MAGRDPVVARLLTPAHRAWTLSTESGPGAAAGVGGMRPGTVRVSVGPDPGVAPVCQWAGSNWSHHQAMVGRGSGSALLSAGCRFHHPPGVAPGPDGTR